MGEAKEPRCPCFSLKLSYNLIFPNPGRGEIHAKKKIPFSCCSPSLEENKKPGQFAELLWATDHVLTLFNVAGVETKYLVRKLKQR